MQTKKIIPFLGMLMLIGFVSCSSGSQEQAYKHIEEGLDKVVKENLNEKNYTVILADMDYKEEEKKFLHKYQVVTLNNDSVGLEKMTDWLEVSPTFFQTHENDLGMELAAKTDGVLKKETAPPGYSQYVGNEKYGKWEKDSSGDSFWSFYGRYAFMSMMFHSMMTPRYGSYNTYNKNYRGTGRTYYGTAGSKSSYGTKAAMASGKSKSSWASKPSSFRSKVQSQVKQSASAQKAASSKTKSSSSSKKTSRTGSSSTRSRGGGFGK